VKQIVNKVLTDSEGVFPFFTKLQTGVTMSANTAKRNPSMRTMRALLLRGASGGALTLLLATTPVRAQLSAFNAALGHNIGGAATAAQVGSVMPTLTPTMNQIIARHTQYQQIVQNQAAIIDVLAELQRELHIGLLFVTHNLALIRTLSQEVAVMSEGRIVERGRVDDILDAPKADYTKKLLSDTPSLEAALAAATG